MEIRRSLFRKYKDRNPREFLSDLSLGLNDEATTETDGELLARLAIEVADHKGRLLGWLRKVQSRVDTRDLPLVKLGQGDYTTEISAAPAASSRKGGDK
jgi:hypothetical protein